ncbi:Serine-arginine protein 55 [Melipona quadrifasciata]|uniref:Serine-arginine protein 55 n=1 Tax=Melipona quadrifasciata TaxID=166423 RepID=A0A0N0BK01_9HYME|nr:Serine-arginine protein 55 [Melipona quadrifasciata]
MSTRVFVGGLTYRVRERDLEKFFRKYGRIREVAMKNGFAFVYGRDKGLCQRFFRGYGRFRDVLIKNGYGFVEFDDYRDADDAVYELNGKELLGERVAVEIARGVSGRRGDRGYGRSRSWRDKITVERARGTPRGSDQWRYGDSRGGYGDSRRSARDDMRHDRDSVNRNTRTASSYKQSLPRYGPPTRTEYRLTVENLSSRVSWQRRRGANEQWERRRFNDMRETNGEGQPWENNGKCELCGKYQDALHLSKFLILKKHASVYTNL